MKLKQLVESNHRNDIVIVHKQITSLPSDLPNKIDGNFFCFSNKLTSLENCPAEVGGSFYCYKNELTSLKDIQKQIKKIDGNFWCGDNPIQSHILGLMLVEIGYGGRFLTKLGDGEDVDAILNKWKNQGRKGVLGCQRDLIAAGYEDLAQL